MTATLGARAASSVSSAAWPRFSSTSAQVAVECTDLPCEWLRVAPPAEEVDDGEQDHRADQRHEQRPHAEVARVDGAGAEQRGEQQAADEGADDAHDDVEENALPVIGAHDHAGNPAEQAADD